MLEQYPTDHLERVHGRILSDLAKDPADPGWCEQLTRCATFIADTIAARRESIDTPELEAEADCDVDPANEEGIEDEELIAAEIDTLPVEEQDMGARVESGAVWARPQNHRRRSSGRELTDQEIETIRLQKLVHEINKRNRPNIVRFDPRYGTYNAEGTMYADASESPHVIRNIQALVEVCNYLAAQSQAVDPTETNSMTDIQILEALDLSHLSSAEATALFAEVSRLIQPCHAVGFSRRDRRFIVYINSPFTFLLTELQPKPIRRRSDSTPENEAAQQIELINFDIEHDTGSIRQALVDGKVPRPKSHQQAIALLDAIMCDHEDLLPQLHDKLGEENTQNLHDLVHALVQQQLGWNSYIEARRIRTHNSGRVGFSSVVRQVTGSQTKERFQEQAGAEPIPELD